MVGLDFSNCGQTFSAKAFIEAGSLKFTHSTSCGDTQAFKTMFLMKSQLRLLIKLKKSIFILG
jgi:hypothetical protein